MPQINTEVLKRLRRDDDLVFSIAKGMNKRFGTVARWIMKNDEMLTSKAVLLIIKEETGLSEKEILEECENEINSVLG